MINNFRGQNFFLSNFYPCKIRFDGLEYKCVESAFQSAKTLDREIRKQFCNLSAKDAKAKGYKVELRDDWEDVKDDIMYQLVKYKFTHSSKLKWMLKKTGTVELVEGNNWNDTYWGKCNGRGQNKLGIILMRVSVQNYWSVNKMLIGLDKHRTMLIEKIPNISTSIIISGSEGIGKFTLTLEVIKSMVSNEENIHVIKPEEGKTQISVEQIRDIFPIINIRPFNDSRHIIIVDEADKLNDVSFNLLLKRLEEPKSSELFILVTSKLDAIADTIKSRCLNINMSLDYNEMKSYISKIEDTDISAVLSRLGFNHVISYIESDAVKSRYTDAKRTAIEALNINSKKQIATISQKLMKDLDISMEMLLQLSETEIVRNTYDMVKQDIMNKQILIEIMLYTLSEGNTYIKK